MIKNQSRPERLIEYVHHFVVCNIVNIRKGHADKRRGTKLEQSVKTKIEGSEAVIKCGGGEEYDVDMQARLHTSRHCGVSGNRWDANERRKIN